jgi:3-oxoacyl-[acyl-carrier protein] reductase
VAALASACQCAHLDAVFDLIAGLTPLRRVTTPEEFADAVLFFLSPWSRAVTGQNLIVDGGLVKG